MNELYLVFAAIFNYENKEYKIQRTENKVIKYKNKNKIQDAKNAKRNKINELLYRLT